MVAATLEDATGPARVLYAYFAAEIDNQIAEALGEAIACHPPESRRYLAECVMTWAKHVDKSQLSRPLAALAETPLKDPGTVRHLLSRQMREQWARKTIPGVVGAHSSQLLKILHSVSKNTTFNKSGDHMVHASLLSVLPQASIAALSKFELPFTLAGEYYGTKANEKVRALFEEDTELRFSRIAWKTAESPKELALLACLLAETPGVSFKVKLCVGHQITEARDPDMPAIFIDDFGYGLIWHSTLVQVDPASQYPLPSLLLRFLELTALLPGDTGLCAQATLRAIKTPLKVGAREPLYSLIQTL